MTRRNKCSLCGVKGHVRTTCPREIGASLAAMPRWKRWQERMRVQGLCVQCGKRKTGGKMRCQRCNRIRQARVRARRAEQRRERG